MIRVFCYGDIALVWTKSKYFCLSLHRRKIQNEKSSTGKYIYRARGEETSTSFGSRGELNGSYLLSLLIASFPTKDAIASTCMMLLEPNYFKTKDDIYSQS